MLIHHEHFHSTHPQATEADAMAASWRFAHQHGDAGLVALLNG
jgi:hypothetical protein